MILIIEEELFFAAKDFSLPFGNDTPISLKRKQ